jgi:hypothetical protein
MVGDPELPPSQDYHYDHIHDDTGKHYPEISIIHYVTVRNILGGEFCYNSMNREEKILPAEGMIYVFEKLGRHRVEPLLAGERCSIITNLY